MGGVRLAGVVAASLANYDLVVLTACAYRPRDSGRDLPLPPSYRGGQLVVEYATVCFRSQEDFGPFVGVGIFRIELNGLIVVGHCSV